MEQPPLTGYEQQKCYRVVPSRYPTINLFEDVANEDELEAVWAIEAMTNSRLNEQAGDLNRVPKADWLTGLPGCNAVMAAFTHINPEGARFTTRDFGGYYCAPLLDTSVKETVYHQERLLGYTDEPPQKIQMRVLVAVFDALLLDITGPDFQESLLYNGTSYAYSQVFANEHKLRDVDGIRYLSVRHPGHDCYVLYRPRLVTQILQSKHLEYHWNGNAITNVLEIKLYGE
ncbi:RES family NAD+ phosphorylase [Shewanella sp. AS16]|uniref:RES family NAD+ phosphorylase n=1 Tax=Shewanella sp. AS16 TaxID=2907625 RepID=UPI001F28E210|nr:RES family NAD+ phosphorylase [Shewanella sp. AS16]MCE9688117.1 RES family NAD+ phosphorylase [Shewanella sp. AS16]